MKQKIKSVLLGLAVADAVGVPYEFLSREKMKQNPATDMIGFGTYDLPPGNFSDDSSLSFCLAEALTKEFDLVEIAANFISYYKYDYWTSNGEMFDIGNATAEAIRLLIDGEKPELAGGFEEHSNGNGSLMRIAPLLFYLKDKPIEERYQLTKLVSSLTHAHVRSVISCFIYLEFLRFLLIGNDKFLAYKQTKEVSISYLAELEIDSKETIRFERVLKSDIYELDESQIKSSGYVIDTLEASIWCFLTTDNYKDAILKAVNLGSDTDTTACVTGALAGLYYGADDIPENWINTLLRKNDIEDLGDRLYSKLTS